MNCVQAAITVSRSQFCVEGQAELFLLTRLPRRSVALDCKESQMLPAYGNVKKLLLKKFSSHRSALCSFGEAVKCLA